MQLIFSFVKQTNLLTFFFSFQIEDIKRIHSGNSHSENRIKLSLDGVSETKSTTTSLDVYSIKFEGCRDVYPIKIVRPLQKGFVNNEEQLNQVLGAILLADLLLYAVIGDNPKRSFLKFSLQHSARFSCEYCFESGSSLKDVTEEGPSPILKKIQQQKKDIQEQIDSLIESDNTEHLNTLNDVLKYLDQAESVAKKQNKSSHIVWPAYTMNGEQRTKEKIIEIVEKIEAGHEMLPSEKKGIKGRSPLLNIEYFDFVIHTPTEYMHSTALGLVKRMIELCFNVGENRSRIITRTLCSTDKFNECMKNVKMFHESSRRARKLDLSVMKAQELRNTLIFFFPIVTKCLEGSEKEIKLWEMLAFMIRACILPEEEFAGVNINQIKYCQKQFYSIYQQLYGVRNCTYSVHVVISHLLLMRALGPLTESSAFRFESFYAELRNSFQPGTVSVVKQMLQNVLLKRILSHHVCKETIYFKEKDTNMECNSLIYTYVNSKHVMYKIQSIHNDTLLCNQIGNHDITLPNTNMLNWGAVGVYRKGGLSSIDVQINRNAVAGKVMNVEKLLITAPNNILREK